MRFLNLLINYPYHLASLSRSFSDDFNENSCGESKAEHNRKWKKASVTSGPIMKLAKNNRLN